MDDDDDLQPSGYGLGDPGALAVAALVVAALSLGGFALLNGATYVVPVTDGAPEVWRTVSAGLVGAALAAVPLAVGLVAYRRSHPGDPSWVPRAAQAAVLVAGLAVVLRVVATVLLGLQADGPGLYAPL